MKIEINTANAPAAIGPYSQAIGANGFVYVSGQLPIDPAVGKITAQTIEDQTRQALDNMMAILSAAGLDANSVVKTTVYLSDIANFGGMNGVYAEYFSAPYPARAAFQVAALPQGALVEIEAVAAR